MKWKKQGARGNGGRGRMRGEGGGRVEEERRNLLNEKNKIAANVLSTY